MFADDPLKLERLSGDKPPFSGVVSGGPLGGARGHVSRHGG